MFNKRGGKEMGPSIEKWRGERCRRVTQLFETRIELPYVYFGRHLSLRIDKPYQQIYVERKAGEISAVFLRYFTNLILAGTPGEDACREIWGLHEKQVRTVMGKAELVEQFTKWIGEISEKPVAKELYVLKTERNCI